MSNPPSQIQKTPKDLGFRMPAEWEPHSAVWLSWPHDTTSFPALEKAESAFADFVKEIHDSEKVELQVVDERMKEKAMGMLNERKVKLSQVRFHTADYADIWFRDYGPIFVVNRQNQQLAMVKWIFNAWGNKYEPLLKDNNVPYAMNSFLRLPLFEPGVVLEGGSIEVNGRGTLITTEQCLLDKKRNPGCSKKEIERYLSDYLGVHHFLWLKEGIEGDDTDGHIDDIARFVNPTTVLCAYQDDPQDPDHRALQENYELLQSALDQDGNKLHVIRLPMPGWVGSEQGRLPASYTNFYIGNTKIVAPIFGTKNDQKALEILQSVFPDRTVGGINAVPLVSGLGTFHCMTQQQPAKD